MNFNCYAQTKIDITNIVDEFFGDINQDGIKDKIVVYKNLKKETDFEQEHFQLPIKIYKGVKNNNYEIWYENDLLLYDNNQTCVSEGYSNIVIKNNYFTIESQSCYDYNILISIYMTFKVVKGKIFLHKYSEEYFDKSNHQKKVPSKFLTSKNFGKIEFNKVSIEILKNKKKCRTNCND